MKSLRNKVILSGIVLLFAFIATIGSTYAWFTVSQSVSVPTMELNVTAAESLLIRVDNISATNPNPGNLNDPSNYFTALTVEQIIEGGYLYDNINYLTPLTSTDPWRLQPSTIIQPDYTSVDGKILNYLNLSSPDRELLPIGTNYNNNTGYYIQLGFILLSQSENDYYLQMSNIVINATALNTFAYQEKVEDAVRLSVFEEGSVADPFIYGQDIDYDFAFISGQPGYSTTNASVSLIAAGGIFNALVDLDSNPVTTIPTNHYDSTLSSQPDMFVIYGQTPTYVTVLVYIDGWDYDASNDIVEALFRISFNFKLGSEYIA
jgi:hypothetical protein